MPSPPSASPLSEEDFDFSYEDNDCWNCGGEGFVANCQQEFACLYPEDGCELCIRRCEFCNPKESKS